MLSKFFYWLNDLKPRELLILAGVVFCLMFALLYFSLSAWTEKEEEKLEEVLAPTVAMRSVITAKSDIPPLTIIKSEMLEMKEFPDELAPSDAITDMEKILNKTAKTEIFAGDIITERRLAAENKQVTFVGSIPPDCRAVSIGVTEVTSVAGFAKPGDRVDLLLVESDEKRSATTSILLQDVLLLSINQNMNKNPATTGEDGKPASQAIANPSIATFALHPDEVLKLVAADKLGDIYLMLRPKNPTEDYLSSVGYTIESINADKQKNENAPSVTPPQMTPLQPIPAQVEEKNSDVNKIEIIQGDQIVQKK